MRGQENAMTTNTTTVTGQALLAVEGLLARGLDLKDAAAALGLDGDCLTLLATGRVCVMEQGWCAAAGNAEVHYPHADSGREAAEEYVSDGDWGDPEAGTSWVGVSVWRQGQVADDDGALEEVRVDYESHTITIEPEEPSCRAGHDHEWCSPYEVLGGLRENPGCWGHGGGVIVREVCRHCGVYRVTDTWAQDPDTGEQGLTGVSYEEADDDSLRWVASQRVEDALAND